MTRDEARAAGLTRFDGAVCKQHRSEKGKRYTASGRCIACLREATARARLDPRYIAGVKERAAKRRLDPEYRERHNEYQRKRRAAARKAKREQR
jgi:hypothetical protein